MLSSATAISVAVSAGSVSYGTNETLTATVVTVPASGTPTGGLVTFYDGTTTLGTGTLTSGTATYSTSALATGLHAIHAAYAGDGLNFLGSSTAVGPNSIITTVAGNGTWGFSGDAGRATAAELFGPTGLAIDASGNLFIADNGNQRVRELANSVLPITVVKADLTLVANSQSRTYGTANPALTDQMTGFVNGDTASVVTGTPTISTTATTGSGVGTYAISVAAGTLAAANYDFTTLVAGTLTVTPAPLVVSGVNQVIVQGQALPTFTVSYSGFVNGDTVASLTTAPSVITTATTSSPAGSYPITPSGGSDPNYQFSYVPGTLVVNVGAERMYRLYNPANGDQIYTNSLGEFEADLQLGLHDESTGQAGWGVFPTQLPGTLPVYRVYLASAGLHYFTLSDGERNSLVAAGWKSEGDEGYLYPTAQPGTTEVFHIYNTVAGIHIFTSSTAELNSLVATPGNLLQQQKSLGFGVAFAASNAAISASQATETRADLSAGVSANPLAGLTTGAAATVSATPGGNAVAVSPVTASVPAASSVAASAGGLAGDADERGETPRLPSAVPLDAYWSLAGQGLATGTASHLWE